MCVPLLLQLHARGRTARGTRGLRSTAQWPRNDRFQQLLDELNVHAEAERPASTVMNWGMGDFFSSFSSKGLDEML